MVNINHEIPHYSVSKGPLLLPRLKAQVTSSAPYSRKFTDHVLLVQGTPSFIHPHTKIGKIKALLIKNI